MNNDKFLREYQSHRFEEWFGCCSDDFKSFARKFKDYLKRTLPGDIEIVGHRCGHYDLSGFVKHGNEYIYYSWTWNRFSPLDVDEMCFRQAVLVRHAKDDRDFTGERNEYTSIREMPEMIVQMFARRAA